MGLVSEACGETRDGGYGGRRGWRGEAYKNLDPGGENKELDDKAMEKVRKLTTPFVVAAFVLTRSLRSSQWKAVSKLDNLPQNRARGLRSLAIRHR